jgi:hypothetical protein
MSIIVTPRLPENRLITKIDELEKQLAELRSKQISGSDVLALSTSVASLSPAYSLTTSYADIGLQTVVTPVADSTALFIAVFVFDANGSAVTTDNAAGIILVNGTPQVDEVRFSFESGDSVASCANSYSLSLTANTTYTVKLQAKNDTANRGAVTTDTTLSYWLYKS